MAQNHRHTDGHGDSMTNSAQWGQVGENMKKSLSTSITNSLVPCSYVLRKISLRVRGSRIVPVSSGQGGTATPRVFSEFTVSTGQWIELCDQRAVGSKLRIWNSLKKNTVNIKQKKWNNDKLAVNSKPWTVKSEQQTVNRKQWTVNS